ncbi:MAG: M20 family metallopeptidase [Methyloligellaceae bacterium]
MQQADLTEVEKRVLGFITEEKWLALATEMIRTGQPVSGNPLDPDITTATEEAIAMLVAGKLEALDMEVEKYESVPHRPNIVGRVKGLGEGPSLMINDHLDTYPAVETERWDKCDGDPFRATRHGDWLYARGTSDTRGNLAAALLAAQALHAEGIRFNGDLIYCFTVDEEKNGPHGSMYMTNVVGLKADYSITAEPTAWGWDSDDWGIGISTANSGNCLIEITLEGIKSHIWRPDTGVNAIDLAGQLIPQLNNMTFQHEKTELMGHTPPCVSIVRIEGGLPGEMQFSPDRCRLVLAVVGIVPGMTMESVLSDISNVLESIFAGRNNVSFTAKQLPDSLFVEATIPVPENEQPCTSIKSTYKKLLGSQPRINRKNAFNDTIRFRQAGMNAVTFGPGEDGWSPINESISIKKSVTAAKIYALAIMDILGVNNES